MPVHRRLPTRPRRLRVVARWPAVAAANSLSRDRVRATEVPRRSRPRRSARRPYGKSDRRKCGPPLPVPAVSTKDATPVVTDRRAGCRGARWPPSDRPCQLRRSRHPRGLASGSARCRSADNEPIPRSASHPASGRRSVAPIAEPQSRRATGSVPPRPPASQWPWAPSPGISEAISSSCPVRSLHDALPSLFGCVLHANPPHQFLGTHHTQMRRQSFGTPH